MIIGTKKKWASCGNEIEKINKIQCNRKEGIEQKRKNDLNEEYTH